MSEEPTPQQALAALRGVMRQHMRDLIEAEVRLEVNSHFRMPQNGPVVDDVDATADMYLVGMLAHQQAKEGSER